METISFGELISAAVAMAFGAWAGVVGWLGHGIRQDIRSLSKTLTNQSERLSAYIVQTETRLAVLEDRANSRDKK